jgi:PGF-pre-PGF domain-containing protein
MTVDAAGNANFTANNTFIAVWPLNATANDTIKPRLPTVVNASSSGGTTTINWNIVTQDVNGNADNYSLRYNVWQYNASLSNFSNPGNVTNTGASLIGGSPFTFNQVCNSATGTCSATDTRKGTSLHFYYVTTIDDNNNENISFSNGTGGNIANVTLTHPASSGDTSGDGGGGGGGGGGGQPTGVPGGVKVSHIWAVLGIGTTTMKVTKEEIGFTEVSFTVSKSYSNVEIVVEKLDSRPASVEKVRSGRNVYQYIKVDKTNLPDTSVTQAIIKFKVEKKWVLDKNSSSSRVVLMRYDDDKDVWEDLETALLEIADPLYYHYEAVSPGLSVFAIATKGAAEAEEEAAAEAPEEAEAPLTAEEKKEEEEVSPEDKSKVKTFVIVTVIILLIIAAAAGSFFYYRKKKGATSTTTSTPQQPEEGKPSPPQEENK